METGIFITGITKISDYTSRNATLNSMPNVLMLPHAAYFTDQALEDMVHNSLVVTSQYFKTMKEQP